ncbi:MAG: C4-dicarboxylate ABC transporter substrate-binding protein [Dethiosulfovibrio peptidovorans]|nr:MAG: C4-dicarboxylate ABC transporter substrate-binding protein [Dethiosulfovibrio peptidovorans]
MKKSFLQVVILAVLSLTLIFCCSALAADKSFSLKLGHSVPMTHPYHLGAEKFKEMVEKETNGAVSIRIFPNNQLGSGERDLLEGMQLGTVDLVVSSTGPMSGFEKKFMLFDFPFLFRDKNHAYKTLDGPIGQYVMGLLEKKGIKGLAWYENGFRHLTNSKRAVKTPEDAEGLKLRTMENKVHMAIWKALGADPTPMAWGELFTALQQGVVDGQENPVPVVYTSKLYEVQGHFALTGHVFSPSMLLISKRVWDKMPEEYRDVLLQAAQESAVFERSEITRMEDEQVAKLKELGMTVTYPDKEPFLKKTKVVYDQFREQLGDDGKLLDQILSE